MGQANIVNKVPQNSQDPSSLCIGLLQSRHYYKKMSSISLEKRALLQPTRFTIQYLQELTDPSLVL